MTAGAFLLRRPSQPVDLVALAERTHGQLLDLQREPTRERCDLMVRSLSDASTQIHRLRDSLPAQR